MYATSEGSEPSSRINTYVDYESPSIAEPPASEPVVALNHSGRSDPGVVDLGLELPSDVLSTTFSLGSESFPQEPWGHPFGTGRYRQLLGSNDSYSVVTAPPVEPFWATRNPISERTASLDITNENKQPKKRYSQLYSQVNGRIRRVYGPVVGNTFGKRGKLSCTQCRKIRSKVRLHITSGAANSSVSTI